MRTEQFQLHADIEQRHWWFVGRRRIVQRLIAEVLPPSQATTIVDVGCGTGANIASLAEHYDCVGIDSSAEAVELARQRFPEVRFVTGYAPGGLGEVMQRARLLLLMDVLEHVADDFAMVSELLAAAVPGSYVLVTVPADPSLWSPHDESFGHYRRYDAARLEMLWAGLPVDTMLLSYFNARLMPFVRLVRTVNRWRGRTSGAAGTDFWLPWAPLNRLLERLYAGEARRLIASSRGRKRPYRGGSSLVALIRREEGPIAVRHKPDNLPPDHQPR